MTATFVNYDECLFDGAMDDATRIATCLVPGLAVNRSFRRDPRRDLGPIVERVVHRDALGTVAANVAVIVC